MMFPHLYLLALSNKNIDQTAYKKASNFVYFASTTSFHHLYRGFLSIAIKNTSMTLSPALSLVLRIVTLAFIVSSTLLFIFNNEPGQDDTDLGFYMNLSFLYALACMCLATLFTLVQVIRGICHVIKSRKTTGASRHVRFDFYGDKVTSYLLLSGAIAMLAATNDLYVYSNYSSKQKIFFPRALISFGLLFVGFLGTAVSSVFSSYSLIQRQTSIV